MAQRGTIIRYRKSWTLVYRDVQIRDGKRKAVRVWKKLATIGKDYPSKASVRHLADRILAPLNEKVLQPESSLLVCDYITDFYFPSIEGVLRPSTVEGYKFLFRRIENKLNIKLRDYRTVHAQRLLREIKVGRLTLVHTKRFLSSVFKFAKQQGVLDGLNPLVDVSVPGRPTKFKGKAYSMFEVARMMEDLEVDPERYTDQQNDNRQTASEVIMILALTGLRTSECRAIRWGDWDEERKVLNVQRSAWKTTIGPTKNIASEGAIPIIPLCEKVLLARKARLNPSPQDYIFAGQRRGTPLNFHNLEVRVIKPALKKSWAHKLENGNWVPDPTTGVEFKGFHGFRRGIASNLFSLGVNPKICAAILRHSDIGTTLSWYIQTPEAESREAMEKLEAKFSSLLGGY
jgi:integrase